MSSVRQPWTAVKPEEDDDALSIINTVPLTHRRLTGIALIKGPSLVESPLWRAVRTVLLVLSTVLLSTAGVLLVFELWPSTEVLSGMNLFILPLMTDMRPSPPSLKLTSPSAPSAPSAPSLSLLTLLPLLRPPTPTPASPLPTRTPPLPFMPSQSLPLVAPDSPLLPLPLLPPPTPWQPPVIPIPSELPPWRHPPGRLEDVLNARFRDGLPSSVPHQMGVLIHGWDGYEVMSQPWRACEKRSDCQSAGASTGGRESAALIFQGLHDLPRWAGKNIPVFGEAGVVLNPAATLIMCGYPGDGSSQQKNCEPPTGGPSCVPGCVHRSGPCDAKHPIVNGWCFCGQGYCDGEPQPLRLADFPAMIEQYSRLGTGYNELILSAVHWNEHLPHTIEAFFCSCGVQEAETHARSTHAAFLRHFQLTAEDVPLLCLDSTNWDRPFSHSND